MKTSEAFLFSEMKDDKVIVEVIDERSETIIKAHLDKIEKATFDIMESIDHILKKDLKIEQYDAAEKGVRKILKEAFCEKASPDTNRRKSLIMRNDQEVE